MVKFEQTYAVELDGALYSLSGNTLAPVSTPEELKGDRFLISDLQKATSRVTTVEAPLKYAEVLVRKQLQESGEFEEPVTVLVHWKKAKGPNTTDIFFTATPIRLFHADYMDRLKEHDDTILLFPLYQVLYEAVLKINLREPVALAFKHDRFADMVVATPKKVYHANRCMAFDSSDEQNRSLWGAVLNEVRGVEETNMITVNRIYTLNWIDSPAPPELCEEEGKTFFPMEEEEILFSGEKHHISFAAIFRHLKGTRSSSDRMDKLYYLTGRWAWACNLVLLAATLALITGYGWNTLKSHRLDARLHLLQSRIKEVRIQAPGTVPQPLFKRTVSFVKSLDRLQKTPSFKRIVNDLSAWIPPQMRMEVLKIDYQAGNVNLEIFGRVTSSFKRAHKGYQQFLHHLDKAGYTLVENRFDTEIRHSTFLLKLNKEIK